MYRVEIKPEDGYLHITASGRRTFESVSALAHEIIDACIRHEVDEVLVDVSALAGRLSIFDSLRLISDLFPELKKRQVIRHVVAVDSEKRSERFRFFERAAQSRGYRIRLFGNIDEAMDYFLAYRQQQEV